MRRHFANELPSDYVTDLYNHEVPIAQPTLEQERQYLEAVLDIDLGHDYE